MSTENEPKKPDEKKSATATPPEERIVLRLRKGSYVGLGCINPDKRMREEDVGSGYTHESPARSRYRDEKWVDDQGYPRTKEVFEDGELIQLWPPLKHEAEFAAQLAAATKRSSFSFKEAKKHADKMVKDGVAEVVHVVAA